MNSAGGNIAVAYKAIDMLGQLKQNVITYSSSYSASVATLILFSGGDRRAASDSKFMLHPISLLWKGKVPVSAEYLSNQNDRDRLNKSNANFRQRYIDSSTTGVVTQQCINRLIDDSNGHKNVVLTPTFALQAGWIDSVDFGTLALVRKGDQRIPNVLAYEEGKKLEHLVASLSNHAP